MSRGKSDFVPSFYIKTCCNEQDTFYLFGLFAFNLFSGYGLDTAGNLAEGPNVTKAYDTITNSTFNQTLSTKDFNFAPAEGIRVAI